MGTNEKVEDIKMNENINKKELNIDDMNEVVGGKPSVQNSGRRCKKCKSRDIELTGNKKSYIFIFRSYEWRCNGCGYNWWE
jgi:hypothetical protein